MDLPRLQTGQIQVDVVLWEPELVEVGARRCGRDAFGAELAHRRVVVPLRELLAVITQKQPVMQHLRKPAAERVRHPTLNLLVRPVVGAAEDVGDTQLEVVGDGGQLIRRASILAGKRDAAEADRPVVVVHGPVLQRPPDRVGVQSRPFALSQRPFIPCDAEPAQILENRLLTAGDVARRIGVVDSKDEHAAARVGKGAVGDGTERVAQMQRPRRARREANAGGAHVSIVMCPGWAATRSSQLRIAG